MHAGILHTSFISSVLFLFILLNIPCVYNVFGLVDNYLENKSVVWLYFTYTLDVRLDHHGTEGFNRKEILQDSINQMEKLRIYQHQ